MYLMYLRQEALEVASGGGLWAYDPVPELDRHHNVSKK